MDFSSRNAQQAAAPGAHAPVAKKQPSNNGKWARIGLVAAIVAVVVILIGVAIAAASSGNDKGEAKYVDSSKLQAVFLNTGQVYFGNIKTLNNKYFVVTNIYYLQTSSGSTTTGSTASNTSVTLVKLGCELHEPYDQMVINRDQVTFWENLEAKGQVATAVSTFQKANPNGQKCADQSTSSSNTSGNSVQSAGTNTTPATTTTTKP